jgi:hypothetical protein
MKGGIVLARLTLIAVVLFAVFLLPAISSANTQNGAEFQQLYMTVIQWASGIPVIIVSIAVVLICTVACLRTGSIFMLCSGFLVAALILAMPQIIQGMAGATI